MNKVAQNVPSQVKSVKMGRKAEVEALLPLKQAWQFAKFQAEGKSATHLYPGNLTLQLSVVHKGSVAELEMDPLKSSQN